MHTLKIQLLDKLDVMSQYFDVVCFCIVEWVLHVDTPTLPFLNSQRFVWPCLPWRNVADSTNCLLWNIASIWRVKLKRTLDWNRQLVSHCPVRMYTPMFNPKLLTNQLQISHTIQHHLTIRKTNNGIHIHISLVCVKTMW